MVISMKIRLGYVAIAKTIDDISYNHTITYTHYSKLPEEEQSAKLKNIIHTNLDNLLKVLKYNLQNKIFFFRFSHNLIPLATHKDVHFDYITPFLEQWQKIGNFIKKHNMRIDSHPDQFCVLNSVNQDIVEQSIKMLKFQYDVYQAIGIEGHVVLHIGSSTPNKESAMKRFHNTYKMLPKEIQKMILLENDDKTFTAEETLKLCELLHIPMVLDYHHHLCNHEKKDIKPILERILNTWKDTSLSPKMHFSSPKSQKEKRAHNIIIDAHKFISFLEILSIYNTDVDIMLECKGKDESLFRLSRQLHFYTKYKFINQSTFIINPKL